MNVSLFWNPRGPNPFPETVTVVPPYNETLEGEMSLTLISTVKVPGVVASLLKYALPCGAW